MNWLILTFLSIFSRSIYGIFTKILSNKSKVSVYTQSVLLPLAGFIFTIILSPWLGGIHLNTTSTNMVALILMVVGQGLGNVVYFAAIKHLTNSTAQIAFSSILVFNALLSVLFLNLHLSIQNIFGIFVLMTAIALVVGGKIDYHPKGISLMIISALCFAVFQLSSTALAKQMSAATYLSFAYFGSAILITLLKPKQIYNDLPALKNPSSLLVPGITAIPSIMQFIFVYFAYRLAPEPSRVALLGTSQVVFTVFLSYIFLKEKTQLAKKLFAAILVIVATYLIKT